MIEPKTSIEQTTGLKLRQAGLTLATAESCTGGLVGHYLTNVSGSSAYYLGGIISYDNSVKQVVLGVPAAVLENDGAVSAECALAMAHGVRRLLGVSLGLSTTGIAGPGGAVAGKPVGLVYLALVDEKGYERCERYLWEGGDRQTNKELSAQAALQMLEDYLKP